MVGIIFMLDQFAMEKTQYVCYLAPINYFMMVIIFGIASCTGSDTFVFGTFLMLISDIDYGIVLDQNIQRFILLIKRQGWWWFLTADKLLLQPIHFIIK